MDYNNPFGIFKLFLAYNIYLPEFVNGYTLETCHVLIYKCQLQCENKKVYSLYISVLLGSTSTHLI